MIEAVAVLGLALALDALMGEPRNAMHPVAWLGRAIQWCFSPGPRFPVRGRRVWEFVYGMVVVILATGAAAATAWYVLAILQPVSSLAYVIAGALVLKTTFSFRGLREAATGVRLLLEQGKLEESREKVRSLVGRDTSALDEGEIASAVVESVAENSCDSVVAPLFYFFLFGVPGAVAYRAINTFDAMVGHHGRWEYPGKFAAILDDVANFVPARLSALLIVGACLFKGKGSTNCRQAWRVMWRDRRRTESPNAGWTMSAAAGALGVRLEKKGFYVVGGGSDAPGAATIRASTRLLTIQLWAWAAICLVLVGARMAAP